MLRLKNIKKDYKVANESVTALKGINIDFRSNEFVSVLGQSGCGKTTLLNIIGGLDGYTSGDLIINGISTKKYRDNDWDTYRNHRVGFIFQSYNLIPHQSVLRNVELALTLSGVSRKERRKRATQALTTVGLADQMGKKPNQMSGGQMQRVAIARALVNNPDILLADEPTGALDSATSLQVMELLKEIARDRLVIMVTHNPELAEKYSTRIIKLLDGEVISDSMPFTPQETAEAETLENKQKEKKRKKEKSVSMSFFTALSLSFNNLMTKKARTFMTSFAGSIGIIGIALILSLSNGIQLYIDKVQEDTLSSYPLTLEESTLDMAGMMTAMIGSKQEETQYEENKIHSNNIMTDMLSAVSKGATENNLADFKTYIESGNTNIRDFVTDIQYGYSTQMNIYKADTSDGIYQVNPGKIFQKLGFGGTSEAASEGSLMSSAGNTMTNTDVWTELLNNKELLESQYDVLKGSMPKNYDEAVLIIDKDNTVSDYTLYTLGLMDEKDLDEMSKAILNGEEFESKKASFSFDDILNVKFKLLINTDYFEKDGDLWLDKTKDEVYLTKKINNGTEIKIVGILRPKDDTSVSSAGGRVGYLSDLTTFLVNRVNESEIVKAQKENPDTDIFSGLPFPEDKEYTLDDINSYAATLPADQQMQLTMTIEGMKNNGMSDARIAEMLASSLFESSDSTYEDNLEKLGVSNLAEPSTINIYPKDFEAKEEIIAIIEAYNETVEEANRITYTDYIGIMMSSVTTIISAISYILIAFVAISLVVSSIMIGIITYISVLERTKEIGILRAIGASKRDISRVFNAETLIVGLTAGLIGIGGTLLLIIPINAIIHSLADISASAQLPSMAAVILVGISMLLTFIAGLFPSRVAAHKDPVVALRTE